MSETPKGRPDVKKNPENNPERLSVLGRLGRVAAKAAGVIKDTWNTMIGRDSDEQAKDISGTIAPEAPVKSGDTSPIANTMSEEQLKSLEALGVKVIATPEYPVYLKSSLPEPVTTPDGRQHPVYPKPSFPKSVTTPDGRQRPAEIEPPKPTPLDMLIDKRKGEAAAAAAAAKYSSSVNPDVYTRVKGENVIDKDMFSTTIPNVDKPKKDDNPEGLTPYEQARVDEAEYGDDEQFEGKTDAEKTEMSVEEQEAAANLKIARERFAKASIAVESHFFKKFFGGKKRQEELNAATEELKQSELEYMRLKFADKIEAAKQDPEKQAELAAEMGQAAFASMRETSRMTTDKYDNMLDDRGKFKKAAAKVGKWFNKGGKIAQLLKLGGTGFAVGATTATFAGWPITTAVGIVTELGVAGATKQAVLEEHRGEDRIADARLETIDPSFKDTVANMKIDDVMEHAVNVSVDNLKDVSIERQDALRKKVRSSLGKYGVGFALGGFAGKFVGDWANSTHATGAESNTATPSQSGSEQIPQSSGASSVDNSVDKIVNNINPDTSNFNSYDYPWDWAAEKFGDANAMDQLHNLADKAIADGHTVQWFDGPGGTWMEVDGSSVTADVLKVLNKYA